MATARYTSARPTTAGLIGALIGIALFVYALRTAGFAEVALGVRTTGAGFVIVLGLSGLRQLLRAGAWTQCVEPPGRLRLHEAFRAFVTGDAIGNLTPFGPLASEGTKAVFVRRQLPTLGALASVALENIFYGFSVAAMIGLGIVALLYGFNPNETIRIAGLSLAAAALLAIAAGWWLLRRQTRLLSGTVGWLLGGARPVHPRIAWIRSLEDRIQGFAARHPGRVRRIFLFELAFHIAAVAEIYLLLVLLVGRPDPDAAWGVPGSSHTLLLAIVLETVNRITTVLFKFVPLRLGVDEAGSGLATQVLALGSAPGVTIAIIRKARTLCWAAVGVALLIQRGFSMRKLVEEAEAVIERERE